MIPLGKKQLAAASSTIVEVRGTAPNDFARKQLEKFGWKAGMGLGKDMHGSAVHVKVAKKGDDAGIGFSEVLNKQEGWNDQWWWSAHTTIRAVKIKARKRAGESSDSSSSESDDSGDEASAPAVAKPPTDEELFKACGGRRLGMRARADQPGKWKRTEGVQDGALPYPSGNPAGHDGAEEPAEAREDKKRRKKEKSEKREKKEKKEKSEKREKKAKKEKKLKSGEKST